MTHPRGLPRRNSVFAGQDVCELVGLQLRQGAHRPNYDEDVWDLTGLEGMHRMVRSYELVWDFSEILNARWRSTIKDIVVAFLVPHHEQVIGLPLAFRSARSPRTVALYLDEWIVWLNWLTGRGVDSLTEVTQQLCDAYLEDRSWHRKADPQTQRRVSAEHLANVVKSVQALRFYGDLFVADRYDPSFIPWDGRSSDAVAGCKRVGENATPPVPQHVLQPLLANCLYFIDVIGPHLIDLLDEIRADQELQRTVVQPHVPYRHLSEQQLHRVHQVLAEYRSAGSPLPKLDADYVQRRRKAGWADDDPLIELHLTRLLLQAQIRAEVNGPLSQLRTVLERTVAEVGIAGAWGRDAATVTHALTGAAVPWTQPMTAREAHYLARHVMGSCLVLTAAVTGMRRSELMEVDVGARRVSEVPGGRRYRLAARLIKGQAAGGVPDEWVVVEEVDRTVALAERLTRAKPGEPLFGTANIGPFVKSFRRWTAGAFGQRLGLQRIPEGPVNGRMLRRTLAVELAKRPGGLLAAKVHLKHVSVVTTEGYAARPGGSQSMFFAEVQGEEHAHHLELTVAAFNDYRSGIMPSGPGARELINAFEHVDSQLRQDCTPPVVITNERRLESLLRRQARVLHTGPANYCWFKDPSKALCLRLAGAADATRPLVGMCDSARCPQATHHHHHRPVWETAVKATETLLGNPRVPKGERLRLQAELDRSVRVLNAIDGAGESTEGA